MIFSEVTDGALNQIGAKLDSPFAESVETTKAESLLTSPFTQKKLSMDVVDVAQI